MIDSSFFTWCDISHCHVDSTEEFTGGSSGIGEYRGALTTFLCSKIRISHCTLDSNSCNLNGEDVNPPGAILLMEFSSPIIDHSTIENNVGLSGISMVGYCSPKISNNEIRQNVSGNAAGAGLSMNFFCNPTVQGNLITQNETYASQGGGVHILGYCYPRVYGNVITYNTAVGTGGGIHLNSTSADIVGNLITNNRTLDSVNCGTSAVGGGGISGSFCHGSLDPSLAQGRIHNNIIVNNSCEHRGAGIILKRSQFIVSNNLISNNQSLVSGGGGQFIDDSSTFINNIFFSNTIYFTKNILFKVNIKY